MLAKYLRSEDIIFSLRDKNKLKIIEGILNHLYENGRITDLKDAIRVVKNREKIRSTGLENGIAIPHGKSVKIESMVIGIARLDNPVDFQAIDNQLCNHVIVILAKKEEGGPVHLAALQQIAKSFMIPGHKERLDNAKTPEDYYNILLEEQNA